MPLHLDLRMAWRSLRRNKARSLLTVLGVIIGVMSVVLVAGIGEGVKRAVNAQTEHLGKDLITIRPGRISARFGLGQPAGGLLRPQDIGVVAETPGVASAVPLSIVDSGVSTGAHGRHDDALVLGTSAALPAVLHQTLAYGAYFDNTAVAADKVVIGSRVAAALYDEHVPLGQTLSILGHQFVVVGIFDDFQTAPLSVDADFNNAVFISYATAMNITNNSASLYEILARPAAPAATDTAVRAIQARLRAAHGGGDDFTVLKQSQTLSVAGEILHLLTMLVAGVAGIALLVAGIGIMNVMLVSTTERMHEIGIRKALGATTRQITAQFMAEAVILSVGGALLGIAGAFVVEGLAALLSGFTPVITWPVVVIVCAVAVGIGIVFGSFPALRAARKDPITALRNE